MSTLKGLLFSHTVTTEANQRAFVLIAAKKSPLANLAIGK